MENENKDALLKEENVKLTENNEGKMRKHVIFFGFDMVLRVNDSIHSQDKPLPCMQDLIAVCNECGDILVCISKSENSIEDEYNRDFIKKHYGDNIQYISIEKGWKKTNVMQSYCRENNIKLDGCFLIDYDMDTLADAAKCGFKYWSSLEVALRYEEDERSARELEQTAYEALLKIQKNVYECTFKDIRKILGGNDE